MLHLQLLFLHVSLSDFDANLQNLLVLFLKVLLDVLHCLLEELNLSNKLLPLLVSLSVVFINATDLCIESLLFPLYLILVSFYLLPLFLLHRLEIVHVFVEALALLLFEFDLVLETRYKDLVCLDGL